MITTILELLQNKLFRSVFISIWSFLKRFKFLEKGMDHLEIKSRSFLERRRYNKLIRDYAKIVSKKSWDETGANLDPDVRLDCYVDPQLAWVKHFHNDGRGNFRENLEDLEEPREKQPWAVFQTIREANKNLVLSDGAGAGKTILTRRLAKLISDNAINSAEPLMVFRFVKPLPINDFKSLEELLLAESNLNFLKFIHENETKVQKTKPDKERKSDSKTKDKVNDNDEKKSLNKDTTHEKNKLIRYALENRRVVVILDGLDEFSKTDKEKFLELLTCRNGQFEIDPVGGDPSQVTTIISGRQHAIDEHLGTYFDQSRFERLKIEPF